MNPNDLNQLTTAEQSHYRGYFDRDERAAEVILELLATIADLRRNRNKHGSAVVSQVKQANVAWDRFLDGRTQRLIQGIDFQGMASNFVIRLREDARKRGGKLLSRRERHDVTRETLYVKFTTNMNEKWPKFGSLPADQVARPSS